MHFGEGVDTTCAADEDLAIVLGVEVDELFAIEATVLQTESTCETRLLIHGEEARQCRVLQGVGSNSRQHQCHTNTIIRTEGCTLSFDEIAIDISMDRVIIKCLMS